MRRSRPATPFASRNERSAGRASPEICRGDAQLSEHVGTDVAGGGDPHDSGSPSAAAPTPCRRVIRHSREESDDAITPAIVVLTIASFGRRHIALCYRHHDACSLGTTSVLKDRVRAKGDEVMKSDGVDTVDLADSTPCSWQVAAHDYDTGSSVTNENHSWRPG